MQTIIPPLATTPEQADKATMAAEINDLHITCGCRMKLFLGLGKFMAGEASARRHAGGICDL